MIETIDKKPNFPAPRSRPGLGSPTGSSGSTNTQGPGANGSPQRNTGKAPEQKKDVEKVITPELRSLLSREIEVLARKDVAGKGDGFLADKGK